MDITSITYVVFVAVGLIVYWKTPKRFQWIILLTCSLLFYFLNAKAYTFIYLLVSVITVWLATNYFERSNDQNSKKRVLVITLVVNFGILAILKYTNLGINTVNFILSQVCDYRIKTVTWAASLGISFYTLQIVSYLLDAYWGVISIEKNPARLLLFTSYFPLMVSGPINTYEFLNHQLFEEHRFDYLTVTHGMKRLSWGLLKKMAISNRIAIFVNLLWNHADVYDGLWIWISVIGYALQLYTDFSGCMDIVIGVSECFGIQLTENFKAPLLSKNMQEFWRRWHITLGLWLKKYIMNPILKSKFMLNLGAWAKGRYGKKKGKRIPTFLSMLVLWLAMGLWHGNSWKYIIGEGFWFWLVIVLSQIFQSQFKEWKKRLKIKDSLAWKIFQIIRTNLLFSVGMLFFHSESLIDAISRLRQSFICNIDIDSVQVVFSDTIASLTVSGCFMLIVSFAMLFVYDVFLYRDIDLISIISEKRAVFRWIVYVLIIVLICASYNVVGEAFAYAQF